MSCVLCTSNMTAVRSRYDVYIRRDPECLEWETTNYDDADIHICGACVRQLKEELNELP